MFSNTDAVHKSSNAPMEIASHSRFVVTAIQTAPTIQTNIIAVSLLL